MPIEIYLLQYVKRMEKELTGFHHKLLCNKRCVFYIMHQNSLHGLKIRKLLKSASIHFRLIEFDWLLW